MTPTSTPRPETASRLQSLIEINIDSSKGFQEAADQIANAGIAEFFRGHGRTRSRFATELQSLVSAAGKEPSTDGSAAGTMHRWWINIRGTVADGDEHAILSEAERGEDAIKHRYEDALKETAGQPVHPVLQRQYASIKAAHDQVRDWRDRTAKNKKK